MHFWRWVLLLSCLNGGDDIPNYPEQKAECLCCGVQPDFASVHLYFFTKLDCVFSTWVQSNLSFASAGRILAVSNSDMDGALGPSRCQGIEDDMPCVLVFPPLAFLGMHRRWMPCIRPTTDDAMFCMFCAGGKISVEGPQSFSGH